ncbi:cytotoxin [Rathayibacter tritici]|uniref:hypothetical protein n=1 Tax=Rathayibacter tritici TaxID=33888 RepID=UPI000A01EC37|nr:hypothetical protein [Rathayibacter tritici]PPF30506.1 cytotoxin [Rathayibacter tritici]PPF66980.1 cytotoxin [Rathayibacter tritici]PPG06417.1 cytotoxin [Rathayibacter tritici]PPI16609.1 cytotoxin [Rathayibacter tritici]PPI45442.1 cytotoxin [Rathayibacter tritici]
MSHAFRVTPNFKKVLGKKPKHMREAVEECIRQLAENPRHPGLHTHKMKGLKEAVFEAYVDNGNRVTFHWDEGRIVLRNNCNHDMLYRNP